MSAAVFQDLVNVLHVWGPLTREWLHGLIRWRLVYNTKRSTAHASTDLKNLSVKQKQSRWMQLFTCHCNGLSGGLHSYKVYNYNNCLWMFGNIHSMFDVDYFISSRLHIEKAETKQMPQKNTVQRLSANHAFKCCKRRECMWCRCVKLISHKTQLWPGPGQKWAWNWTLFLFRIKKSN